MKIINLASTILALVAAEKVACAADVNTNVPSLTSTNAPVAVVVTNQVIAPVPDISEPLATATTNALRMNLHDVPLGTVLNYLSAKAGFIFNSDVELHGNATIISEQPMTTNEVLDVLSSELAKNNYSVTRNGRILTITTADAAKTSGPVNTASSASQIPLTDEIATTIIPVHTLNPTQLIKDLEQLVPPGATLAANEAGNSVIMTGRQKDTHRFVEIINALDGSSVAEVEVFVLKYADAKAVADELKEIFQSPDSTVARSDSRQRFRGGGFNPFGGGGGGGENPADEKNAANKAVFVSDDQMNALVASAPPDYMPQITNIVAQLDHPSQDITEMRVFHLKYVDPQEMADELSNLFPDPTAKADQSGRSMGFRFTPPWMQPATPTSTTSERMKVQQRVVAVADRRTESIIVTTSRDLMLEIEGVIEDLDRSPAGVQHVYAVDINSADPAAVQATMAGLFPNSKAPATTSTTDALTARATSTANQQQSSTSSTTGFGSTGSSSLH
jgi:general secretion pathway protein D